MGLLRRVFAGFWDGTNEVPYKNADGKPRVSSTDYLNDIAEGNIANHSAVHFVGERPAVAIVAGGEDIWPGTTSLIPRPADAGEQLAIVSTSAQDGVAGTGIQTVRVEYLDAAGALLSTDAVMNGIAGVNLTPAAVRFVQRMCSVSPAGQFAAGTITLYKSGAPATVYEQIAIGDCSSKSAHYMVPAGYVMYITSGTVTGINNKNTILRLRSTSINGTLLARIPLCRVSIATLDSGLALDWRMPLRFPALTVVTCTAFASGAGAIVTANFDGWIEPA